MTIAAEVATAMTELGLGDEFSLDDILDVVQTWRGRPLRIMEYPELKPIGGVYALWLPTEREDVVLYAPTDSALHRQQFVLHELAHMILDHEGEEVDEPDVLLPDIPAATRRRLLRRQHLLTEKEMLAEALADRLAAAIRGSASHESRFMEIFG